MPRVQVQSEKQIRNEAVAAVKSPLPSDRCKAVVKAQVRGLPSPVLNVIPLTTQVITCYVCRHTILLLILEDQKRFQLIKGFQSFSAADIP